MNIVVLLSSILFNEMSGFCRGFLTPEEVLRRHQKYHHIGCFRDRRNRLLAHGGRFGASKIFRKISVEECYESCLQLDQHTNIFAVQKDLCFCETESSQKYDLLGISERCQVCEDSDSNFCGGHWSNSVYQFN